MNWPVCIACRRSLAHGHNPDTCKPWLALERDYAIYKGWIKP